MNFQAKDKVKRIKIAKELFEKGFSHKRLADYFDVSEDTVKTYLEYDIMHDGNKEIIVKKEIKHATLSDFTDKTTTMDKVLPKMESMGDKCKLCNEYAKYDNMVRWDKETILCKRCYATMDREKMNRLSNI